MDKTVFKQKTLEIIEDMHQRYIEQATKVIDNMDESELAEFEDNYFAPKAFYEALTDLNADRVTERSYTRSFVREHKKAVTKFFHEIAYKRF